MKENHSNLSIVHDNLQKRTGVHWGLTTLCYFQLNYLLFFSVQVKAKRPVLPGVNKWLRSSNEYGNSMFFLSIVFHDSRSAVIFCCFIEFLGFLSEKAVVHNFMNTLNNASSSSVHMKQSVPKATEKKTTKPQFTKELYFQQRAKSARSQRVTERPTLPPRPKSVRSVRLVNFSRKSVYCLRHKGY